MSAFSNFSTLGAVPEFAPDRPNAAETAAQMRAEFDRSFSLPSVMASGNKRDFVIIMVAGAPYALATADIVGIERADQRDTLHVMQATADELSDQFLLGSAAIRGGERQRAMQVVPVPSKQPALLGIRSFSGRIVPVFALATLLGAAAPTAPAYCALAMAGIDEIAFAFDSLVRLVRVEPEQIFAATTAQAWQQETLSEGEELFAIVAVSALMRQLRATASQQPSFSNLQDGK
jgi:chemotaxis signal transduction protein